MKNGISRRESHAVITKVRGRRKTRSEETWKDIRNGDGGSEFEAKEEGRLLRGTAASKRAFNAKAAVKPAVSTNVRNINLREVKPAYTS